MFSKIDYFRIIDIYDLYVTINSNGECYMKKFESIGNYKRAAIVTVALAVGSATVAGCGTTIDSFKSDRGTGDVPVGEVNSDARDVWQNVDGFPNVSAFCIGATGIYSVTGDNRDPLKIVGSDPNCAPGGILASS